MSDQPTPSASANAASNPLPSQRAVHEKYLALLAVLAQQPDALSKSNLVIGIGMEREGAELSIAAMLTGASFLGMDPNPATLKLAQQHHACDFIVNSLDEALRVLKNAIRKRQPVAVGLLGDAGEILPCMVERGVQPDFLSDTKLNNASTALLSAKTSLAQRGAIFLDGGSEQQAAGFPIEGESLRWVRWTTAGFQDMQRMDALALSRLPIADVARRRWLENASTYFYRQLPLERVCTLSAEEITSLLSALKEQAWRASLREPITFDWQDADGTAQSLCVESKESASAS